MKLIMKLNSSKRADRMHALSVAARRIRDGIASGSVRELNNSDLGTWELEEGGDPDCILVIWERGADPRREADDILGKVQDMIAELRGRL